jgi:type I restriction enzyme S subunit
MTEWSDVRLGDVITLQRGFDLPSRDRVDGPFPIVSSSGVTGFHDEFKVEPPGVVIGRYGSLGRVHWVAQRFWPLNTSLWVKDFKGNDPRFVSYLLETLNLDASTASAVPGVNRNHLHLIPVVRPPLETQRRIASLLSTLDELIQICHRRVKLLQGLTRSLYREWFVRLRFPGHEVVRLVDSELGRIPESWSITQVAEVFDPIGGGTPSRKRSEYWELGDIPWFTPSDLTRARRQFLVASQAHITSLGLSRSNARAFPSGSVMMTSRATLGVLAVATRTSTCNQGFIVIPPAGGLSPQFIYEWLDSNRRELESLATGATFKEITKGAFRRFPFVLPPPELLEAFRLLTEAPFNSVQLHEREIAVLTTVRDLVLPRLVDGRVDVSRLDLGGSYS